MTVHPAPAESRAELTRLLGVARDEICELRSKVCQLEQDLTALGPADERERRLTWMRRRLSELEVAPVPKGGHRLTEEQRLSKAAAEYEQALARHEARIAPARRARR